MADKPSLESRADSVLALMGLVGKDPDQPPSLMQLKKEAHQFGKRRCDRPGIDNLTYHAGYAIACNGGLNVDSVELTGLLSSASLLNQILREYCPIEVGDTSSSVLDVLRRALEQPHVRDWAYLQGAWLQNERLAKLDADRTAGFTASDANDPEATWRNKYITAAQHYRVGDQCRILRIPVPTLINRGEAYDFIARNGGNLRLRAGRTPPPALEF